MNTARFKDKNIATASREIGLDVAIMAVIVATFLWGGYASKTEPLVVRPAQDLTLSLVEARAISLSPLEMPRADLAVAAGAFIQRHRSLNRPGATVPEISLAGRDHLLFQCSS